MKNIFVKVAAVICSVLMIPLSCSIKGFADSLDDTTEIYINNFEYDINSSENKIAVPVNIQNNSGFSTFEVLIKHDSRLTFDSLTDGILDGAFEDHTSTKVAVTYASGLMHKEDGVLFYINFNLPKDMKANDKYNIDLNVRIFSDTDGNDVDFTSKNGSIDVVSNKTETTTTTKPIVSIESLEVEYSGTITVPVKISGVGDISSLGISIKTDSDLKYIGYKSNISSLNLSNRVGTIGITAANNRGIDTDGVICELIFEVPKSNIERDYIFKFNTVKISDMDYNYIDVDMKNGVVFVKACNETEPSTETEAVTTTSIKTTQATTRITTTATTKRTTTKTTTTSTSVTEKTETSTTVAKSTTSTSKVSSITTKPTETTTKTVTKSKTVISVMNVNSNTYKAGDTIQIPVKIENNTGFSSTGFKVTYPTDLTLERVESGIIKNPQFYAGSGIASVTSSSDVNLTENGILFTLCFTIQKNIASEYDADICIQKLIFSDVSENDIGVETKNLNVKFVKPLVTETTAPSKDTNNNASKDDAGFGDVNNDGKIDSKDAVKVLVAYANFLIGKDVEISKDRADVNSDGEINSKDAVIILSYYAHTLVMEDNSGLREFVENYKKR